MKRLNLKLLSEISGVSNAAIRAGYKQTGSCPVELSEIEVSSETFFDDDQKKPLILDLEEGDITKIHRTRITPLSKTPYERQAYDPIPTFSWSFMKYCIETAGLSPSVVCDSLRTAHRYGYLHNIVALLADSDNQADLDKVFFLARTIPNSNQNLDSLEKQPPSFVKTPDGISFENMKSWKHLSFVAVEPFWNKFNKRLSEYGLYIAVKEQEGFPLSIEFEEK